MSLPATMWSSASLTLGPQTTGTPNDQIHWTGPNTRCLAGILDSLSSSPGNSRTNY